MLDGQKIVVVMPAYNAARTLRQTYDEVVAHDIVDEIILVDDASHDETAATSGFFWRVSKDATRCIGLVSQLYGGISDQAIPEMRFCPNMGRRTSSVSRRQDCDSKYSVRKHRWVPKS
jgi:hypothetical protein